MYSILNNTRLKVFFAIWLIYLAIPNARPDFTPFNAHDSESYLALSYNLVNEQRYTRSLDPLVYIPHTTWPPGIPILLMPAVYFSGDNVKWFYVKLTIIIVAMIAIYFIWCFIFRITGSKFRADLASLFVALNPHFWHFSHIAMAEVPMLMWIFASLLLIDFTYAFRQPKMLEIIFIGTIVGVGMLIKGSLVGLILVPLCYIWGERKSSGEFLSKFKNASLYGLFFCVPFLAWSYRNSHIDKSKLGFDGINQVEMIVSKVPTDPSLGFRNFSEILTDAINNFLWHAMYNMPNQVIPYIESLNLMDLPFSNYLYLTLTLVLIGFSLPLKYFQTLIWCLCLPMALLTILLANGGSERYWIPISILFGVFFIAFRKNLEILKKRVGPHKILVIISATLLINLGIYVYKFEKQPYSQEIPYKDLAFIFQKLNGFCDDRTKIYSPNSHALQLISGCKSPISLPPMGLEPKYTHVIYNKIKENLLNDATPVLENASWRVAELSSLTQADMIQLEHISKVKID